MADNFDFSKNKKEDETQTGLLNYNTKKPVTQEDQNLSTGTLKVDESGAYYSPESTVETMNALLSNESPYITQRRSSAQRAAASRGLQNTSMAATAGESAAIEGALPIAQQESQYYQDLAKARQEGNIQERLYNVQGDISSRLSSQEARQASQLSEQEYGQSSKLSAQGYKQSSLLSSQEAKQASALSSQEAGQRSRLQLESANQQSRLSAQEHAQTMESQQADIAWQKQDLEARLQLEYDTLSQDSQNNFNSISESINSEYINNYTNILQNPNFATASDRQAAINALNAQTQQRFDLAASVAGVDIEWNIPKVSSGINTNPSPRTPANRTPSATTTRQPSGTNPSNAGGNVWS